MPCLGSKILSMCPKSNDGIRKKNGVGFDQLFIRRHSQSSPPTPIHLSPSEQQDIYYPVSFLLTIFFFAEICCPVVCSLLFCICRSVSVFLLLSNFDLQSGRPSKMYIFVCGSSSTYLQWVGLLLSVITADRSMREVCIINEQGLTMQLDRKLWRMAGGEVDKTSTS